MATISANGFTCEVCGKGFKDRKALKRHRVAHDPALRKAACDQCGKSFRCNNMLKRHVASAHGTSSAAPTAHRCEICEWSGYSKATLKRHEKSHLTCSHEDCRGKKFKTLFLAKKHALLHRYPHQCPVCNIKFLYREPFLKHLRRHRRNLKIELAALDRLETAPVEEAADSVDSYEAEWREIERERELEHRRPGCFNCGKRFTNRWLLNRHLRRDCDHLKLPYLGDLMDDTYFKVEHEEALRGCVSEYKLTPLVPTNDEKECLERSDVGLVGALKRLEDDLEIPVKWSYTMEAQFVREKVDGEVEFKKALFTSGDSAYHNSSGIIMRDLVTKVRGKVYGKVDKYTNEGSNWILDRILNITLQFYRIKLNYGGAGAVRLPNELMGKRCVINLETDDCFRWAVLSALHHTEVGTNTRVEDYEQWRQEFDFPQQKVVCAADVEVFVRKNHVAVYLHSWSEKGAVECTYRPPTSMVSTCPRVHLLLYKQHWMAITNLSALYRINPNRGTFIICDCCLATFYSRQRFEDHLPCRPTQYIQREVMPQDPVLRFKDFNKCVDLADIVYADTEAILEPVGAENATGKLQKHIPCCVGAYWLSSVEGAEYSEFKGRKCVEDFCDYLENLAVHIAHRNKTSTRQPAQKTQEEMARHEAATECKWCHVKFVAHDKLKMKVFDHDHLTGKYRGAACQGCNNRLRQDRNTLIVAFHNFRHYDAHSLCLEGLASKPKWGLQVIAQTTENYLSVSAYLQLEGKRRFKVKFIDTCQLMNSSLEALASNLVKNNDYSLLRNTMAMRNRFHTVSEADLAGKGIFPYTYIDSWEKLEEQGLPNIEAFYDTLRECVSVSEADYARAIAMYDAFECSSLYDYQLRYLELDCRLLADVFEQFRALTRKEDEMDAAHFITVSQLSYSSALKWCTGGIGLIEDPEIFRDVELCKRGGYAFVNKHRCKANNPYVHPGKPHSKDDVYLGNVDANNLYGNALRHPLPVGDFRYLTAAEIEVIDWKTVALDSDIGYFVVCDLHYPVAIHNKTAHLPLAPELLTITEDLLTPYSRRAHSRKNLGRNPLMANPDKFAPTKKLLATCLDKKEYSVHFAALQLYLNLGLELTRVHRVIKFKQAPIFRDYIDYNTKRRSEAVNEFQKDYYKAKNCHLFGKSLENKRGRIDIKLCNSGKSFVKCASQPRFRKAKIFKPELVAAELTKANVELDAPVAIGAAVLDLSKVIMYKLAYQEFPRYERMFDCKISIVGGDTDSFFLEVTGVDLYWQLYRSMLEDGLLDTSNYDPLHQMFTDAHKAELGCIKDEFKGDAYDEFVLLRPKSYSMRPAATSTSAALKKRSKGVPRRKVQLFSHEDYQRVYETQIEKSTNCRRMQSTLHVVYTIEQHKIALSSADDKRAWLSNNYSLPYGHYLIPHLIDHPPEDDDDDAREEYVRSVADLYAEIVSDDEEGDEGRVLAAEQEREAPAFVPPPPSKRMRYE